MRVCILVKSVCVCAVKCVCVSVCMCVRMGLIVLVKMLVHLMRPMKKLFGGSACLHACVGVGVFDKGTCVITSDSSCHHTQHTHAHAHTYKYTYTCTCTYIHTRTHTCTCTHTCTHTHALAHTHTHTHANTRTQGHGRADSWLPLCSDPGPPRLRVCHCYHNAQGRACEVSCSH